MENLPTQTIITETQTGRAPADGAIPLPAHRRRVFSRRLLSKAAVLGLLSGLPLGASLLIAGEVPKQPQYQFIEIPVPIPSEALGINDNGMGTGISMN